MNKIIKKLIVILSILVLFIFLINSNFNVYASGQVDVSDEDVDTIQKSDTNAKEHLDTMEKKGDVTLTTESNDSTTQSIGTGNASNNSIVNDLLSLLALLPNLGSKIISKVVTGSTKNVFSIQDLLCNCYLITDINIFKTKFSDSEKQMHNSDVVIKIRKNIKKWYDGLTNIALVFSAIILIYIGARMAMNLTYNSNPRTREKYKKMLYGWLIGFVLLWVLKYLLIFLIYISEILLKFIRETANVSFGQSIEKNIVTSIWSLLNSNNDIGQKFIFVVEYYIFIFFQYKFFFKYLKRMLKICFFILISPLICLAYPIDSASDNRSQSYEIWFKEIFYEIFMQPIQLLLYIVLLYSASEIIKRLPFLGIIFLFTLSKSEKLVKQALRLE